ncbi:thymidine phosphorylase [Pseudoruegeria sp. SHC-113]|uniref:thymidine phosphorylase n=1 Tax=Pseudoruegeria sp. SHC-113 TaxID=2855439 RepID=UPI0021BA5AD9|nr:thymidine phosphorylase [Pseudoruegeria sp. SHC-113]MCT8161543.1 thymidine phosphorylase [Pseudoruegeria sp. SHC-113]
MDARAIIAKVRTGETPGEAELQWFAEGLSDGGVSDAQAGAFAMAVLLNGLSEPGRVALTKSMRDSGDVLGWDLPGPVLDKHSTGGVGDCVSLLLAPALAAAGAYVPMISGRGLGHTGGTLDKLEAIPGLNTQVDTARLRRIVESTGCAIVSASARIAPADKRLYAIRDVTATVESVDLITASILSKKLAAGLDALVLDVKCGSGAFMKTPEEAIALADVLVRTANGAGCPTRALVTDMNQPCAQTLGNALEVMEVMALLTGDAVNPLLTDLTIALGGELLALGGVAADTTTGQAAITDALESGAAAERFGRMISDLGGPGDFVEHWRDRLPAAPVVVDVMAQEAGRLAAIDGEALGQVVVHLGGGRLRQEDRIDPAVGLSHMLRLGEAVDAHVPLCRIHAKSMSDAEQAALAVRAACTIAEAAPAPAPLVLRRLG